MHNMLVRTENENDLERPILTTLNALDTQIKFPQQFSFFYFLAPFPTPVNSYSLISSYFFVLFRHYQQQKQQINKSVKDRLLI